VILDRQNNVRPEYGGQPLFQAVGAFQVNTPMAPDDLVFIWAGTTDTLRRFWHAKPTVHAHSSYLGNLAVGAMSSCAGSVLLH
jgi:hypothetical protein